MYLRESGVDAEPLADGGYKTKAETLEYNPAWWRGFRKQTLADDRAVCIDRLYYNHDGTLQRVVQTSEGLDSEP